MSALEVFSHPRSVVVVGASADPTKWGHWIARGALNGADRRPVHLVNAGQSTIHGVRAHGSLADVPGTPDLVVLCNPAASVPDVVDEALERGARGFVGITAGIDAAHGDPGLERRLAERIRAAGARIVGPNCLGLYDTASAVDLVWGTFEPGHVAIVSQSGQLGLELAGLAAHEGLGVSRFVSIGNQVDVTAAELLEDLIHHEQTHAVVLYLESFVDGRALVRTMARLTEAGKPVVVLTVGASEASRAAARSHTGALTAATDVVRAACRAAGASLVQTPAQAVELAHLLLGGPLPAGRRVAVVSDSGGQGAIAADTFTRQGLVVSALGPETQERLAALLPPGGGVANPVDLAGAGERDLTTYAKVVDTLASSEEIDAVVLSGYFGCYGADTPDLVERELEVVRTVAGAVQAHGRPVVVHSMSHDSVAVRAMRALSLPTLHTIDAVARSLELATTMAEDAATGTPAEVLPPLGGSAAPRDYLAGRDLLATAVADYPGAAAVRTVDDVHAAAARLTAPYVLKAGWLEHKSDVGGVVVGLADAGTAAEALTDMRQRLGEGSYVLEEMDTQSDAVELIVGARRDGSFGPIVMVGLGGVQAELYRDVEIALAPVTEDRARTMLRALRGYPLLDGWRGRPAVDVAAAAGVVAAVSRLIADTPELAECEINPLRVGPKGAVPVDALVLTTTPDQDAGSPA